MDIKPLKEAGLTDGEIKVYLALLELGISTTGPILEKSKIARSIIYRILSKLMEKGLVSHMTKEKTKYFQAEDPIKLLEYVDQREELLLENKKRIEEALPNLRQMQKMSPKSAVSIYTGIKGIRTAHEHQYLKLKKGDYQHFLGIPGFQPDIQHVYWKQDHLKRIKHGIKAKFLFNKDTPKEVIKNRNSFNEVDARYMQTKIKTPAMFLIYKDTTLITIQDPNPVAVEIINQDIADSFLAYFNEFWKQSKPFNP